MADYNERKFAVLELMVSVKEATSFDVSEELGITQEAVHMALMRYHWQGLLSRSGGREKTYMLAMKGEERLSFLEEFEEDEG